MQHQEKFAGNERPGSQARDYADAYRSFDLAGSVAKFFPGGIINAAVQCCDAHCGAKRTALCWESQDGQTTNLTFEQLKELSGKFAAVLQRQGIGKGDRIGGLLPRTPELLVTALAAWRIGAVYQPLFTAFGPKALDHRVSVAGTKVIVTDSANRPKLDMIDHPLTIITVRGLGDHLAENDLDFHDEVHRHAAIAEPLSLSLDDPFLIMFTSGTTGLAKAVLVPLRAIVPFANYVIEAVGLLPTDAFWNMADPGWAYGLYFGIVGPLAIGHSIFFYDGAFTPEGTIRIIRNRGISNLAGAPTAYRLLATAGPEAVSEIKGQLRAASSAGEPLNPEIIRWFAEHLEATIHDHYGQTEVGMVICNHHGLAHSVESGTAGFASPGYRAVVLDKDGQELSAGIPGDLAIDLQNSSLFWFAGYEGLPTSSLGERYYLTGDTAELNLSGSISFIGRADDVITSSGYRIGPFDVESALIEHPAVVEAGVIGKPDPERTEIVKAFVVLGVGHSPSPDLAETLRRFVRDRLSAHAYPREIEFVDNLPKTPSGKIQRFVLRNQELAKAESAARGN